MCWQGSSKTVGVQVSAHRGGFPWLTPHAADPLRSCPKVSKTCSENITNDSQMIPEGIEIYWTIQKEWNCILDKINEYHDTYDDWSIAVFTEGLKSLPTIGCQLPPGGEGVHGKNLK